MRRLSALISCLILFCACTPPPPRARAAIVPHDVVSLHLAEDIICDLADDGFKTVVLIAPNHSSYGPRIASTRDGAGFGSSIGVHDELIENEHSIGNLLPIISRNMPNAQVIPIIFQRGASFESARKIIEKALSKPDTIIIASIDFSHGLPTRDEQINRAKMLEYIQEFDSGTILGLDETYLDAPVVLAALLEVLEDNGVCNIDVVASSSNAEVLGEDVQDATGYLTIMFYK